MVFRRAGSITMGIGREEPWKLRLFWALKWLRAKRVAFAQKSPDFQGPPLPMPRGMDLPTSKP
jgi:hypothetical protein